MGPPLTLQKRKPDVGIEKVDLKLFNCLSNTSIYQSFGFGSSFNPPGFSYSFN